MSKDIGFVFDLDGTLINSTDIEKIIKKEIYKKFNIQTSEELEKDIEKIIFKILHSENRKKLSTKLMWAIFKIIGLSFLQRIKALRLANQIFKREIPKIKLYSGTKELFAYFDLNSIDYAIVTTSSTKEVYGRLKNFPNFYEKLKNKIISRDDVKNIKPHPESIKLAAKRIKTPLENIIMVGDQSSDILMGQAVGAVTIGVTTGILSQKQLLELNPNFIFESVAEIYNNIEKIRNKINNK